jgi:hypothetical protein
MLYEKTTFLNIDAVIREAVPWSDSRQILQLFCSLHLAEGSQHNVEKTGFTGFKAGFFQFQPWESEFPCSQPRCKGHRNNGVN